MVTQQTQPTSWANKLQRIDRRILYLILFIVIAIPTVRPITIPNAVSPMSLKLWETIDQTPKGKIVLISSTWTNSTRGENKGQAQAVIEHLMNRRIPFALSSFTPPGVQVAMDLIEPMAKKYNYVYGKDWVVLGFQPSPANFVKGINVDFIGTVKQDAVQKKPLQTLPIMRHVKSIDDVHIVIEISASAAQLVWIQFLKPGVKLGFCPTSVMAPEALPYYASGQISGMLWGAKGAYDYEMLNQENRTGGYGFGRQYMGPLAAAFGLVIVSIAVGNIAMFLGRTRATGRGE